MNINDEEIKRVNNEILMKIVEYEQATNLKPKYIFLGHHEYDCYTYSSIEQSYRVGLKQIEKSSWDLGLEYVLVARANFLEVL